MKLIARWPTLLAGATALALFAGSFSHHVPRGFHQW
jgi:hypothetical protein